MRRSLRRYYAAWRGRPRSVDPLESWDGAIDPLWFFPPARGLGNLEESSSRQVISNRQETDCIILVRRSDPAPQEGRHLSHLLVMRSIWENVFIEVGWGGTAFAVHLHPQFSPSTVVDKNMSHQTFTVQLNLAELELFFKMEEMVFLVR